MLHEASALSGCGAIFTDSAGRDLSRRIRLFARRLRRLDAGEIARPLDYMDVEALDVLPELLAAIGFRRGLLVGTPTAPRLQRSMPAAIRSFASRPRADRAAFHRRDIR